VRYEPSPRTRTDSSVEMDIKTLRLDLDRHSDDPVLLYMQDASTGEDLIAPLDVIDAIRQIRTPLGETVYNDQEDIDRGYEFPVEITFSSTKSVTITIEGWEVVTPPVEIND
jgi:hypothetical protein